MADSPRASRQWITCPICGELDMRSDPADAEGGRYIYCSNINCASNGGTNADLWTTDHPAPGQAFEVKDPELDALQEIVEQLRPLDGPTRTRVLTYLRLRFPEWAGQ